MKTRNLENLIWYKETICYHFTCPYNKSEMWITFYTSMKYFNWFYLLIQLYAFKLYLVDQILLFIGLLGRKYTKSNIRIEVIYRFRFATWMVSVKMCSPQVRSYKKLCHVMMSTHNNGHKCEESISIICSSFSQQ